MIKITLNDTQAAAQLKQIAAQLEQPRKLYGLLGESLKKIHNQRFEDEKAPNGKSWKTLSPHTVALKAKKGHSGKILRQRGHLADTLAYNVNAQGLEFGSPRIYARLHQYGGQVGKGHKVNVPARPWLGVSDNDEQRLLEKSQQHLQNVINKITGR